MWTKALERLVCSPIVTSGGGVLPPQEHALLIQAVRTLANSVASVPVPTQVPTSARRGPSLTRAVLSHPLDSSSVVHSYKKVSKPLARNALCPSTSVFYIDRVGSRLEYRSMSSSATNGSISSPAENYPYPVKSVEITTCGPLYRKWKADRKKGYTQEDVPLDGIKCVVEYADTMPQFENLIGSRPSAATTTTTTTTVLALHGAPGDFHSFGPIIQRLASERQVRVIAPNFPTFGLTEKIPVFRHSSYEKTEYLKDFLRAINVNRIDAVVAHSSALFPALLLHEDPEGPDLRSFVLINPAGHRLIKAMKPRWFVYGNVCLFLNPFTRNLIRTVGTPLYKLANVSVDPENLEGMFLSSTSMKYAHFENVERQLKLLRDQQVPLTYIFGLRDNLVDKEIFQEMVSISGATSDHYEIFGKGGILAKTPTAWDPLLRVSAFEDGGHYTYKKYSDIIQNKIIDHLDRLEVLKVGGRNSTDAPMEMGPAEEASNDSDREQYSDRLRGVVSSKI